MDEDVKQASLNYQSKLVGWVVVAAVIIATYQFQRFLGAVYDVPWAHVISYFPYVVAVFFAKPVSVRYLKWRNR